MEILKAFQFLKIRHRNFFSSPGSTWAQKPAPNAWVVRLLEWTHLLNNPIQSKTWISLWKSFLEYTHLLSNHEKKDLCLNNINSFNSCTVLISFKSWEARRAMNLRRTTRGGHKDSFVLTLGSVLTASLKASLDILSLELHQTLIITVTCFHLFPI